MYYQITIHHDSGCFTKKVQADNEQKAKMQLSSRLGCPDKAIGEVKPILEYQFYR
jgi:hypothetical protein